mmetsp:Transcript_68609/g.146874  ORF Transcript_68609/g.146874 Transcript_68609/m.146874 type:complete len:219 (+) Transcript_68609:307-963(+)
MAMIFAVGTSGPVLAATRFGPFTRVALLLGHHGQSGAYRMMGPSTRASVSPPPRRQRKRRRRPRLATVPRTPSATQALALLKPVLQTRRRTEIETAAKTAKTRTIGQQKRSRAGQRQRRRSGRRRKRRGRSDRRARASGRRAQSGSGMSPRSERTRKRRESDGEMGKRRESEAKAAAARLMTRRRGRKREKRMRNGVGWRRKCRRGGMRRGATKVMTR